MKTWTTRASLYCHWECKNNTLCSFFLLLFEKLFVPASHCHGSFIPAMSSSPPLATFWALLGDPALQNQWNPIELPCPWPQYLNSYPNLVLLLVRFLQKCDFHPVFSCYRHLQSTSPSYLNRELVMFVIIRMAELFLFPLKSALKLELS